AAICFCGNSIWFQVNAAVSLSVIPLNETTQTSTNSPRHDVGDHSRRRAADQRKAESSCWSRSSLLHCSGRGYLGFCSEPSQPDGQCANPSALYRNQISQDPVHRVLRPRVQE